MVYILFGIDLTSPCHSEAVRMAGFNALWFTTAEVTVDDLCSTMSYGKTTDAAGLLTESAISALLLVEGQCSAIFIA
jgi:hypothetical protein